MSNNNLANVGFVGYSHEQKEKAKETLKDITGKFTVLPVKESWIASNTLLSNPKKHDGAILFSNVFYSYSVPITHGGVFVTGLNDKQQDAFEILMNLKPGTLSPYNSFYWGDKNNYIKITKDGKKLDCDNVILDKLHYLNLKASVFEGGIVALSKMEVDMNPMCELLIKSEEKEAKVNSEKLTLKSKAFARVRKASDKELRDYLRVYEKKVKLNDTSDYELINGAILEIVDRSPEVFLKNIDDPSFKDFILLEDLMDNKIIRQTNSGISTADGQPLGKDLTEAVVNLRSPDKQELKLSLVARLDQIKKK